MLFGLVRQGLKCEGEYTGPPLRLLVQAQNLKSRLGSRMVLYHRAAGLKVEFVFEIAQLDFQLSGWGQA